MTRALYNRVILIVGMGRSGTTAIAQALARHEKLLHIEEPNFITALYLPYVRGELNSNDLTRMLTEEGWRGPMKFSRSMATMYPEWFGNGGVLPVRELMRREIAKVVKEAQSAGGQDRCRAIKSSLGRIMAQTCQVAGKSMWLVKQPNAVLSLKELCSLWPDLRVVHVSRRLDWVLRSRLLRGFQSTFEEALSVCTERLRAAAALESLMGKERCLHVKIEDACVEPEAVVEKICRMAELPFSTNTRSGASGIRRSVLEELGDPSEFFSQEQRTAIQWTRCKMNRILGNDLV